MVHITIIWVLDNISIDDILNIEKSIIVILLYYIYCIYVTDLSFKVKMWNKSNFIWITDKKIINYILYLTDKDIFSLNYLYKLITIYRVIQICYQYHKLSLKLV